MVASLGGNLPGATLNSFIGSLFTSIADAEHGDTPLRAKLLSGLVGGCFFIGSTVFITIISRRALRNTVDLNTEPASESSNGNSLNLNTEVIEEQRDPSLEIEDEIEIDMASKNPIVVSPQASSSNSADIGSDSQEGLVDLPVEDESRTENGFTKTEQHTMIFVSGLIVLALSIGVPLIFIYTTPKGTTWKS